MAKKQKEDQPEAPGEDEIIIAMNALALRMFHGQSDHVPMIERVRRIKANLEARGYADFIDHLELPHPDFKRYL